MKTDMLATGSPVTFDSDTGIQHGTILDIKTDLTNGAKIALVRVAGTLGGMPWQVPVNELSHTEAA